MRESKIRRRVHAAGRPSPRQTGITITTKRRGGWWYWKAEYDYDYKRDRWLHLGMGDYGETVKGRDRSEAEANASARLAAYFMREWINRVQADHLTDHQERVW